MVLYASAAAPATLDVTYRDIGKEHTVNNVQLVGRLATDVELKEVSGGSKVSSFIVAVDRTSEEADFAILPTPLQ